MRLHLVSLPHTQVTEEFCHCAYTSKVLKFCRMMQRNHQIYVYAPEGPEVEGAELVSCLDNNERVATFGPDDDHRLPAWPSDQQSERFNAHVVAALKERYQREDLVLLSGGRTHKTVRDGVPEALCCEPFVGYEGIMTSFCAFESYAWMHYIYGRYRIENIRWFDTVINPYADEAEFPYQNNGKGEYLAFLGRRIERKGLTVAGEIAARCKLPLWVAGAGDLKVGNTHAEVRYLGPIGIEERAEFLAGAKALVMPTIYCEPGGNVAIEAMMCGTPVICPDFGVMSETVKHDVSGYHFRVLREAVEAVQHVEQLDPIEIRSYAVQNFSLHVIKAKFDAWFTNLYSLWGNGWYH